MLIFASFTNKYKAGISRLQSLKCPAFKRHKRRFGCNQSWELDLEFPLTKNSSNNSFNKISNDPVVCNIRNNINLHNCAHVFNRTSGPTKSTTRQHFRLANIYMRIFLQNLSKQFSSCRFIVNLSGRQLPYNSL